MALRTKPQILSNRQYRDRMHPSCNDANHIAEHRQSEQTRISEQSDLSLSSQAAIWHLLEAPRSRTKQLASPPWSLTYCLTTQRRYDGGARVPGAYPWQRYDYRHAPRQHFAEHVPARREKGACAVQRPPQELRNMDTWSR